mmetsp:Transcript_11453/g.11457  ORF Transcript_11453/g.11457 Transcript_11453/m.11457 type:complete len:81 (+) Transcript_11453:524-766(+)
MALFNLLITFALLLSIFLLWYSIQDTYSLGFEIDLEYMRANYDNIGSLQGKFQGFLSEVYYLILKKGSEMMDSYTSESLL